MVPFRVLIIIRHLIFSTQQGTLILTITHIVIRAAASSKPQSFGSQNWRLVSVREADAGSKVT